MSPSPSKTAKFVALARAIGVSDQLRDPMGARLAAPDARIRHWHLPAAVRAGVRTACRTASLGLVDHNTVRMCAVDGIIEKLVGEQPHQLVIIGAGFDARAWRLRCLRRSSVFELDRKATQTVKRARVAGLPLMAERVAWAAVDLEESSLPSALCTAGFDVERRTTWICEGVSAYLDPKQITALLQQVAQQSSADSRLILSYVTPPTVSPSGATKGATAAVLKILGERVKGLVSQGEMTRMLELGGFEVETDAHWKQWAAGVPGYSPVPNLFRERLVVARRTRRS